ncbi:hypothetical protein N7501_010717 [Penicillium viridicatum]|nr:hypothetical protein N7501_010717 [Penicillium viridicatum]
MSTDTFEPGDDDDSPLPAKPPLGERGCHPVAEGIESSYPAISAVGESCAVTGSNRVQLARREDSACPTRTAPAPKRCETATRSLFAP